ncbi:MAG TPA: cysteine hydrolase family protein [Candidatus Hydrogenedentes bacterium]|nr:cysteine hydrolase family protein [Candidatus Hydrogenedentota bacterium]
MKTALLLIDIQIDYFPGGKFELVGSLAAGQKAAEALAHFRANHWPVIHIQHISTRSGATFFLPDTEGVMIHSLVAPLPGETVFQKHFPNSFRETPLLEFLHAQTIEQLAIAGMMTAMCVDATVRAAFDYGFSLLLLYDAMATRDLQFKGEIIPAVHIHGGILAALGSVYGQLISVAEFTLGH